MCFFGGAINRIAAYGGLRALLLFAGAPDILASAVAGIITGGAMMSSNLLSLEGANRIRFEGLHSVRECCAAAVSAVATFIDCGMAVRGLYVLTNNLYVSCLSIPFMICGLYPLLLNKLIHLSYSIYGEDPYAELLDRDTVQLLSDIMKEMESAGCTLDSDDSSRAKVYLNVLGMGDQCAPVTQTLDKLCIYGPYSRRRNTVMDIQSSGLLQQPSNLWTLPEEIHNRALEQRKSRAGVAASTGLLVIALGPAVAYVMGDSMTLVQLAQHELSNPVACDGTIATIQYWLFQGGTLAAMSGKSLAAAKNGAKNIERLVRWLRGRCDENGEATSCLDYALNTLALTAATFYALNNAGTVAGAQMDDDCLGEGTVAIYIMPISAAVGGYGFNAGCGPELKKLGETVKSIYTGAKNLVTGGECCNGQTVSTLADAVINLRRLSGHTDSFENGVGQNNVEDIHEETEPLLPGHTVIFDDDHRPSEPVSLQEWLLAMNLPLNLQHIIEQDDEEEIKNNRRKLIAYLKEVAGLLSQLNASSRPTRRGAYSAVDAFLLFSGSQHLAAYDHVSHENAVKALYKKLSAYLLRLTDPQSVLTNREKRFVGRVTLRNLERLIIELINERSDHPAVFQLLAFMEGVSVPVVVHQGGGFHALIIDPDGDIETSAVEQLQASSFVLSNGVGNWTFIATGQDSVLEAVVIDHQGNHALEQFHEDGPDEVSFMESSSDTGDVTNAVVSSDDGGGNNQGNIVTPQNRRAKGSSALKSDNHGVKKYDRNTGDPDGSAGGASGGFNLNLLELDANDMFNKRVWGFGFVPVLLELGKGMLWKHSQH